MSTPQLQETRQSHQQFKMQVSNLCSNIFSSNLKIIVFTITSIDRLASIILVFENELEKQELHLAKTPNSL